MVRRRFVCNLVIVLAGTLLLQPASRTASGGGNASRRARLAGTAAWINCGSGFAFNLFVLAMLAVDLLVFHKEAHEVSLTEAATGARVPVKRRSGRLGLLR